jgi:hypothetical protein
MRYSGIVIDSSVLGRHVVQIGKQLLTLRKIILPLYSRSSSLSLEYNSLYVRKSLLLGAASGFQ